MHVYKRQLDYCVHLRTCTIICHAHDHVETHVTFLFLAPIVTCSSTFHLYLVLHCLASQLEFFFRGLSVRVPSKFESFTVRNMEDKSVEDLCELLSENAGVPEWVLDDFRGTLLVKAYHLSRVLVGICVYVFTRSRDGREGSVCWLGHVPWTGLAKRCGAKGWL